MPVPGERALDAFRHPYAYSPPWGGERSLGSARDLGPGPGSRCLPNAAGTADLVIRRR
jgi:hypothetical protein